MHRTRKQSTTKLPIQRKGTKYIARALSDLDNSVPVVIALRDMLNLAKTAKEVKKILLQKDIKINGRKVFDYRDSVRLFDVLEAGKSYRLSILPTGKFFFEETKNKDSHLCKVTSKRLVKNGVIQLGMHEGSNILTKEKIKVGDSIYLDFSGKIKKHISLVKGNEVFVMSGRHIGQKGKIMEIKNNKSDIQFEGGSAEIELSRVVSL